MQILGTCCNDIIFAAAVYFLLFLRGMKLLKPFQNTVVAKRMNCVFRQSK